jgi:hypothetical protein
MKLLCSNASKSKIIVNSQCTYSPAIAEVLITGRGFLYQANRIAIEQVKSKIEEWQQRNEKKSDLKSFQLVRNDSTGAEIAYTREFLGGLGKYTVTMTPKDFRVESWTYDFLRASDNAWAKQRSETRNSNDQKDIPLGCSDTVTSSKGNTSYEIELVEFQLEPAPLHVFAIPQLATSSANTWLRRGVVFGVGLICLIVYRYLRRR